MRVGIDIRLAHWPGIGRYIEETVLRLAADFPQTRFVLVADPASNPVTTKRAYHDPGLRQKLSGSNVEVVDFTTHLFSPAEPFALARLAAAQKLDVFHAPYFNVPLSGDCPLVTTLHDFRHPDLVPKITAPRTILKFIYYEAMLRATLAHSDALVCVSQSLADDVLRFRPAVKDKITVIKHGVSASFYPVEPKLVQKNLAEDFDLTGPYFLFVGTLKPHKNLLATLEAFALAIEKLPPGYSLVIAAEHDPRYPEIPARVNQLGLAGKVRFLGHVPKNKLVMLYCGARATLMPSSYESFGLPVLESMACGTPVIAAPLTALPEIAGDAACYALPEPQPLAGAMLDIASNDALYEGLRSKGLHHAQGYSWGNAARQLHEIYVRLAHKESAS